MEHISISIIVSSTTSITPAASSSSCSPDRGDGLLLLPRSLDPLLPLFLSSSHLLLLPCPLSRELDLLLSLLSLLLLLSRLSLLLLFSRLPPLLDLARRRGGLDDLPISMGTW